MSKLDELRKQKEKLDKQQADLEKQIEAIRKETIRERMQRVSSKLADMTDEKKKLILSLMEHDRTSCSDESPCNGYSEYEDHFRCTKCMLMEIFNGEWGGQFDFKITAEIEDVTKHV